MLTAAELTRMRSTAGAALPDSCVVQSQAWVSDSGGGGSLTWTAAGTVDCRIAPIMTQALGEDQFGGRISANAQYIVTLPQGTGVTVNDRILVNGGTFAVSSVRDRSYEVTERIEVKQEV